MSTQSNIDLDKKYAQLQQQVNGIKNCDNNSNSNNSIFSKLLKPPYIYIIIVFIIVLTVLLYFKPVFVMNIDRKEVTDIKTKQKLPRKVSLNIGKLLLFTILITGIIVGGYYLYNHFTKKKSVYSDP